MGDVIVALLWWVWIFGDVVASLTCGAGRSGRVDLLGSHVGELQAHFAILLA